MSASQPSSQGPPATTEDPTSRLRQAVKQAWNSLPGSDRRRLMLHWMEHNIRPKSELSDFIGADEDLADFPPPPFSTMCTNVLRLVIVNMRKYNAKHGEFIAYLEELVIDLRGKTDDTDALLKSAKHELSDKGTQGTGEGAV